MHGFVEYATDLFDAGTVGTFVERWMRLLEAVVADPGAPIGHANLLGDDERRRLLADDTDAPVAPSTLPALLHVQRDATPHEVAVVHGDSSVTYCELHAQADRLAHMLINRGIGPEDIVALALPRSLDLVVAILAVVKAGAAYMPVDLEYPRARIEFMLADARPALLLTTAEAGAGLPTGIPGMVLDDPDTVVVLAGFPSTEPTDADRVAPLLPQHPAYVIHTSGSTGRPKAVVTPHAGLASLVVSQLDRLGVDGNSQVLQFASPSFDGSLWEVCMALLSGGTLVVASAEELLPGKRLASVIRDRRVTHVTLAPLVLDSMSDEDDLPPDLTAIVVGESPSAELVDRWSDGRRLINVYGPTEATICATISLPLAPGTDALPPIGGPVVGTRLHVLDAQLQLVPVGVVGQLYIAGAGVGRGYLNQPALSAERYVACPFGPPGARMYRTGDLVRRRPDGDLEFVSRVDHQLSVRGLRVEPGEIENVLTEFPAVAQAAVVQREDGPGDARLVAYVVANADCEASELRTFARSRLPRHMVPAAFVVLEEFPLSPNGKLDRAALPALDLDSAASGLAPKTPREQVLTELFAEVLDLERVGADSDFFDLGGHSMSAMRLIDRIRSALGVDVGLQTLFQASSPSGLAAAVDADRLGSEFDVILPLRPAGRGMPLFCVHPGGGISWSFAGLLRHLDPECPVYGVQARGLSGPEPLPGSVEEMAADYVAQIRRVQPAGPYHMLGWSFGGLVAHAMAVELRRLGEQVAVLAIMDAYPHWPKTSDLPADQDQDMLLGLLDLLGCDVESLRGGPVTIARAKGALAATGDAFANLEEHHIQAIIDVLANNTRLAVDFTPSVFDGDLLLFPATVDRPAGMPDSDAWSHHVAGSVETNPVDCTHGRMTQPAPLALIGSALATKLKEAEKKGS
ncbi:amino acid adenylation domain-containing protein [Saccharopolyspora hattusasensis]|uniref:amino acid adenylation domain-containing protein n=1 Tax=Saccharopolyspora hattusasensis TaxID=1128679 RepID=UPI003D994588